MVRTTLNLGGKASEERQADQSTIIQYRAWRLRRKENEAYFLVRASSLTLLDRRRAIGGEVFAGWTSSQLFALMRANASDLDTLNSFCKTFLFVTVAQLDSLDRIAFG